MENLIFTDLFNGVSQNEIDRMLCCFQTQKVHFEKGETLITYQSTLEKVGILLTGKAHLYCIDYDGTYTLLERLEPSDLFGELFSLPLANLEYIVEADSSCDVLFIPYSSIIKRCENACQHHTQIVDNLFHMATKKSQALSLRINLLTAKTIRQKLLHYFLWVSSRTGTASFRLEMSLTDLSDYLCIDRSSMMREMHALRDEGILDSKGRQITLLAVSNQFSNPQSNTVPAASDRYNEHN